MANDRNRQELEQELAGILKENREAFNGEYAMEIEELLHLSKDDLKDIVPNTTPTKTYDLLIEVVKEASRQNLAQAELKVRIEHLGEIAVRIAKRVPSIAALFA